MSFPEKLLAEDEEVVEHLHPHWITLVPGIGVFILVCALAGVGVAFLPSDHLAHEIGLIAIPVIALAVVARWTVGPLLAWRSTHYVFTTHRVLIRRGVLRHTGRDITLARINDVSYVQTLFDRMLGAGSLTIESAGESGQEKLAAIPHADEVQQTLNRLIEQNSARRAQYGADDAGPSYGQFGSAPGSGGQPHSKST